jgi:hypothetical protein
MKKILSFFGLCAYAVGTIGGIGYACYNRAFFIAVCVALLAWFAFPKAKQFFNELTEV